MEVTVVLHGVSEINITWRTISSWPEFPLVVLLYPDITFIALVKSSNAWSIGTADILACSQ